MALIKCKDCKKEFSTDAKRCPHCGARKPGYISTSTGLIIIVLFIAFAGSFGGSSNQSHQSKGDDYYAKLACKEFTRKSLHDPDSAEFDRTDSYVASQLKTGNYHVMVTLRAKNAFNALRHGEFSCEVSHENGNWNLVNLKQIAP